MCNGIVNSPMLKGLHQYIHFCIATMPHSTPRICPHYFVINLANRVDRWNSIETQLKKHNISKFTRIPAVDGKRVDLAKLKKSNELSEFGLSRLNLTDSEKVWGMDLTKGALGCALSHFQVWKLILGLSIDFSIVVEDDTEFAPDFHTRFDAVCKQLPKDWDLVFLSGLDTQNVCGHMKVRSLISLVPVMFKTTNLYLITPRGAKRMLDICAPLHFQLDTQMTLHSEELEINPLARGIQCGAENKSLRAVRFPNMYAAVPPIGIQKTTLGSDIQFSLPEGFESQENGRKAHAGW